MPGHKANVSKDKFSTEINASKRGQFANFLYAFGIKEGRSHEGGRKRRGGWVTGQLTLPALSRVLASQKRH